MPATSPHEVFVVRTGVANIASMLTALDRLGAQATLTEDPARIASAARVVLPGVGAFGAGMQRLIELGADEALRERVTEDRPTFCVCLGLQLLCKSSEESPDTQGLGLLDAQVRRFQGVRTPQLGWNEVTPTGPALRYLTEPGWAYYANSYRLEVIPQGWGGATSDHGGEFVAALERGHTLACQFHPELSSSWGLRLMRRWLDT